MAKPWAKSFYNSKAWKSTRKYILRRDHLQCQCYQILGGDPCGEPAEEVHHIEELTPQNINDPRIALHESNLLSLSGKCHKAITALEHGGCNDAGEGFYFDDSGMLRKIGG